MTPASPSSAFSPIHQAPYQHPPALLQGDGSAPKFGRHEVQVGGLWLPTLLVLGCDVEGREARVVLAHGHQGVGAGAHEGDHLAVKGEVVGVSSHVAGGNSWRGGQAEG